MCNNLIKCGFSRVSQELFWDIYDIIKNDFKTIVFATKDRDTGDKSKRNNEWFVITETGRHYFLDFFIQDTMTVIEFDGEYWHNIKGRKESEHKRDEYLTSHGYRVHHVKELDYYADSQKELDKCIEFIYAARKEQDVNSDKSEETL